MNNSYFINVGRGGLKLVGFGKKLACELRTHWRSTGKMSSVIRKKVRILGQSMVGRPALNWVPLPIWMGRRSCD